jgi:hypothetical protein
MVRFIAMPLALLLTAATPAAAAAKRTELTLSYQSEAGYAAAVVLRCDPAGGPHPKKGKACQALAKVNGNPEKLKPANVMCTQEYAPITAGIEGTWKGRRIDWSKTYSNPCLMRAATGILLIF